MVAIMAGINKTYLFLVEVSDNQSIMVMTSLIVKTLVASHK